MWAKAPLSIYYATKKTLPKAHKHRGKTQLINFFITHWKQKSTQETSQIYLVDLPGFGYAKVSKTQKKLWDKNLVEFLQKRDNIRLFVHLVDSRHPHLQTDKKSHRFYSSISKKRPKTPKNLYQI